MTTPSSHPTDDALVLHHYEPDRALASHLEGCTACRARRDDLRAFLADVTTAEAEIPERGDGYGREVWRKLAPRLRRRRAFSLADLFAPRRLAFAGGLLALVVAAFLAGRGTAPAPIPAAARERILLVAVGEHLERSQMVLMELLNSDEAPAGKQQARAEELVSSSRLYRQTALRTGETDVARVLEDLEPLLLDIARTPSPLTREDRDALRQRVEKQGVLFKLRILGTRIEQKSAPRANSSRI